jgi:hypothetical protein
MHSQAEEGSSGECTPVPRLPVHTGQKGHLERACCSSISNLERRAAWLAFAPPRRMHNGMALRTVSHQGSLILGLCVCVLVNASMPVEIGLDAKVTCRSKCLHTLPLKAAEILWKVGAPHALS